MATTFIVEDGTGKSDANAYITEAFADQYWEDHDDSAFTTTWTTMSQAEKEMAIRMATQYLDTVYKDRWKGVKKLSSQLRDWPRSSVRDSNEYIIANDSIPIQIANATAEAAIRHENETDGLLPDLEEAGMVSSYSVRAGPVSESTSWVGGRGEYKEFSMVETLLTDLLERKGVMHRS